MVTFRFVTLVTFYRLFNWLNMLNKDCIWQWDQIDRAGFMSLRTTRQKKKNICYDEKAVIMLIIINMLTNCFSIPQ